MFFSNQQIFYYNRILITTNNIAFYLHGPQLKFYTQYFELWKNYILGNISGRILLTKIIGVVEYNLNLLENDLGMSKSNNSAMERLIQISNKLNGKISIKDFLNTKYKQEELEEFNKAIIGMLEIHENYFKVCENLNIRNTKFFTLSKEIYFGACLEFYHAISHLYMSYNSDIQTQYVVDRAVSHINRAVLDMSKITLFFIKDAKQNNMLGVECRIDEIYNVSNNVKTKAHTCYTNKINQFISDI